MKKWSEKFDRFFSVVTFAEANCHDVAMEMLNRKKDWSTNETLSSFLENVGLNNVRVCYATVKV